MSDTTAATPEPRTSLLWIFRILFALCLVDAAIVFGFFVWGLADGTITSFNIDLWLLILAGIGLVPAVGWFLRRHGKILPAIIVLSFMALPGLIYVFFMVLVLASGTSWN